MLIFSKNCSYLFSMTASYSKSSSLPFIIYSTLLPVLELISQFHCQLETCSHGRKHSWSQIFSASTLSQDPDSCIVFAELHFVPTEIIDIFTVFL